MADNSDSQPEKPSKKQPIERKDSEDDEEGHKEVAYSDKKVSNKGTPASKKGKCKIL